MQKGDTGLPPKHTQRITSKQRKEITVTLQRHRITPVYGELAMTKDAANKLLERFHFIESL